MNIQFTPGGKDFDAKTRNGVMKLNSSSEMHGFESPNVL